ncbi:hypothetical protein [Agromyces aureus]|nr:hypothetical protein [Agromyces aureus]
MAAFKFDTVLSRQDTAEVVAAVESLGTKRRLSGRGVYQGGGKGRQFRFAVDEAEQWWVLEYEDGRRGTYRDGIVDFGGRDEPHEADFFRPLPQTLQLLWPTRILTWANPHGSFYPVLVQHVGRRSLLFTFEHIDDPAFRQTLVVDQETGIAKRLIGYDYGIILTSIDSLSAWSPTENPTFEAITGPVPTNY